ncbi:hypothetical protein OG884_05745 [Streptosporangium sp. NBC_01755]|uniref:hypothetical protein n=1 Tax=Streptosporangium sp. NBC_01755 TaxID=2975949 RepID=UPI002DDB49F5|nr:hypothetical protein [Streptosporangium sp. NBC_01755]WSD01428.1 hypothetical protein OG884_05745 [Streptosporangium sp. NBC_01755]
MSYPPDTPQGPSFTQPSTRSRRRPVTEATAASGSRNRVGVAAVTIGGLALICALIPPIASLGGMLGIVTVIVALVAITRVALRKANNMVVSITAFGLGIAAIAAAIVINQIAG